MGSGEQGKKASGGFAVSRLLSSWAAGRHTVCRATNREGS
jgi:hypothetical protein